MFGHGYAYFDWERWKDLNIFYISMYNVAYCMSLALNILAKSKWLKMASGLCLTLFSYLLYLEFVSTPWDWSAEDMVSGFLAIIFGILVVVVIDKIKKRLKK